MEQTPKEGSLGVRFCAKPLFYCLPPMVSQYTQR